MRCGSGLPAFLAAVLLALLVPSAAGAATVVNGDFESGTLSGWHVHRATGLGDWYAYKGTATPVPERTKAPPIQAPPEGTYAAITDEVNPDTLILYQDIALEAGSSYRLSLLAYYRSNTPIAVPPSNTLSVAEEVLGGKGNQQYRIDVMRPDAPIESVDPADILRTLLWTKPGDPEKLPPTRLSTDLTPFAGQTVRLRIANAAHEEIFNAGVDAVSLSANSPGQSPSRGGKHGPILFGFGKLRANRRKGIVTLRVRVSGPGLVRATGAPTPAGTAGSSRAGKLRKPIEPITVPVASAKTVTIHLRPTSSTRAILRRKGKLRVLVSVTYMPIDGSPEAASLPVVFKLKAG